MHARFLRQIVPLEITITETELHKVCICGIMHKILLNFKIWHINTLSYLKYMHLTKKVMQT